MKTELRQQGVGGCRCIVCSCCCFYLFSFFFSCPRHEFPLDVHSVLRARQVSSMCNYTLKCCFGWLLGLTRVIMLRLAVTADEENSHFSSTFALFAFNYNFPLFFFGVELTRFIFRLFLVGPCHATCASIACLFMLHSTSPSIRLANCFNVVATFPRGNFVFPDKSQ